MTTAIGIALGEYISCTVRLDTSGTVEPFSIPAIVGRETDTTPTWTAGWEALLSPHPHLVDGADRITDPYFIPALMQALSPRIPNQDNTYWGACLPGRFGVDRSMATQLAQRLRSGQTLEHLRVMSTPEALMFAALLDNHGKLQQKVPQTIVIVDVGIELSEVTWIINGQVKQTMSVPQGVGHALHTLRSSIEPPQGAIPMSILMSVLSDTSLPEDMNLLDTTVREHIIGYAQEMVQVWSGEYHTTIEAILTSQKDEDNNAPFLVLAGEGLICSEVKIHLESLFEPSITLPWYGHALGLARHIQFHERRNQKKQHQEGRGV